MKIAKRRSMMLSVLIVSRRCVAAFRPPSMAGVRVHSSMAAGLRAAGTRNDETSPFQVQAKYEPRGDQPHAIEQISRQLREGARFNVLKGATGTGKTFVMSHVIANHGRPTLVLVHNKTLAAQLARELRSFFPDHAVELFISAFKTYRPESYKETTGKYLAKKSTIDSDIEALRHLATRSLMTRQDVVVVASISCIYGLGLPDEYLDASTFLEVGQTVEHDFVEDLERMLYQHNPNHHDKFTRGDYQWREVLDAHGQTKLSFTFWPPQEQCPMRVEFHKLSENTYKVMAIRTGTPTGMKPIEEITIFPAKHYVVSEDKMEEAAQRIEMELQDHVKELMSQSKWDEAENLQRRTWNDLMMLREQGWCKGMENYSFYLSGREKSGDPPCTLMDYLGEEWLLIVDESHVTLPQLDTMYRADRSRKLSLIKHGYRLPSALDNRPLTGIEFWERVKQTVFVSATPAHRELMLSENPPVEMVIRPTFVQDPAIHVRSPNGQLEDLLREIKTRALVNERTLAMVLTKKDAEDLALYLNEHDVKSDFIHSGLGTQERSAVLKSLQSGEIDCVVGVNLLREGIDLPECSLVAVFNADADGLFRSHKSLLQIIGRAARNVNGTAILYANRVTDSMRNCMEETAGRRARQRAYIDANNVEMVSSTGSSIQSTFDLLRDKINLELATPIPYMDGNVPKMEFREETARAEQRVTSILQQASIALAKGIETDHIPSLPGVYYWKDAAGRILYIGKAKNLRGRVMSYLTSTAKKGSRIAAMIGKATSVEFEITPSDRDALVLESKLIKHHQPPYNILLKDDNHYPYICAEIGGKLPSFTVASYKDNDRRNVSRRKRRYFGPYTSYHEINQILSAIDEKYDLRTQSFLVRHGDGSKERYQELFQRALKEVFFEGSDKNLQRQRDDFEEAGLLFESPFNACRDVAVIVPVSGDAQSALVHVVQLRQGLVTGRFSYPCRVPAGFTTEDDYSDAIQNVLEKRHYPSGEESTDGFSFFPDEILLSHSLNDMGALRNVIDNTRKEVDKSSRKGVSIKTASSRGERKLADARALEFALENARHTAARKKSKRFDETAAADLASLLSLEKVPEIIECYDVSHTQGDFPVASRVVFVNGEPAPHLYRTFNIKTVQGVDDYASIKEAIKRRFSRARSGGREMEDKNSPWDVPDLVLIDGGTGQLSAAIKGLTEANLVPGNDPSSSTTKVAASVAIAAIAKDPERVYIPGQQASVNDLQDSPAMLLLRSLRDESHRFALKAHRRRRSVSKVYQ